MDRGSKSPLERGENDESEMQDLFVDDLDAIFDDDPGSDEFGPEPGAEGVGQDLSAVPPLPVPSGEGSSQPGASTNRRRRSANSTRIEKGDRGIPPPSWHSEAADKSHRQQMILDM